MFKRLFTCGVSVFALAAPMAIADDGGMTGGGGTITRDQQNPWFLQNTPEIRYCVSIDPRAFHQSEEVTRDLIKRAFGYWKNEVRDAQIPNYDGESIQIATQRIREVSCTDEVDVTFQMGYLTSVQLSSIKEPKDYAGLAVRTDYDPVNLRGKGFVYIGADAGPLQFGGDQVPQNPWNQGEGGLLYRVLIHELGHVFGIRHTDEGSIMADDYVDMIMRFKGDEFTTLARVDDFFRFRGHARRSSGTSLARPFSPATTSFFNVPKDTCGIWMRTIDRHHVELKGARCSTDDSSYFSVGTVELGRETASSWLVPVKVYLPPQQKVFKVIPKYFQIAAGPIVETFMTTGTYHSATGGIKRPVMLQMRPSGPEPTISTFGDGKMIPNIMGAE